MKRRWVIRGLGGAVISTVLEAASTQPLWGNPASAAEMVVYKSPACGCCRAWVRHLQRHGLTVTVKEADDLEPVKDQLGIPDQLRSCHTGVIEGYAVEGHVPATEVRRLLVERPAAIGLSVPGMPAGTPGMELDDQKDPFEVILFSAEKQTVYQAY